MSPLDILVSVLVVAAMASVGLDIDARRLESLRVMRRLIPAVLLVNYVGVPLVALAAAAALPVDPRIREGVLLCALAPGGASATLIAARMRADATVAAAVVIVTTATSVVLTPVLIAAVLGGGEPAAMLAVGGRAGLTALAYQALPLGLGAAVRRLGPGLADRLAPWTSRIANAALAILVIGLLVARGDQLLAVGAAGIALALLVTVAGLGLGALVAPGDPAAIRAALGVTAAIRSLSLALVIAAHHFPHPGTTQGILVHGLLMYLVTLGLAQWRVCRAGGP
jgi:predicted Na+-dependent transporter